MDIILIILIALASILSALATLVGIGYARRLKENTPEPLEKLISAVVNWLNGYASIKSEERAEEKPKTFAELKKALDEMDEEMIEESKKENVIIEPIHRIKDDYEE